VGLSEKKKEDIRWNRQPSNAPVRMYIVIGVVLLVMGYLLGGMIK